MWRSHESCLCKVPMRFLSKGVSGVGVTLNNSRHIPGPHMQSLSLSGSLYVFLISLILKALLGSTRPSVAVILAWRVRKKETVRHNRVLLLLSSFTLNFPHLQNKILNSLLRIRWDLAFIRADCWVPGESFNRLRQGALFLLPIPHFWGFSDGASGKEPACQCRRPRRRGFDPWVGKISWRMEWQPTPVFLPGESRQRSLEGYSP